METGNVLALCFSAGSASAPTRLLQTSLSTRKTPGLHGSHTDLPLALLGWLAGEWTQLHWQPVLTASMEERQQGQSMLSQEQIP